MIVGRNPLRVRIGEREHVVVELAAPPGEFAITIDGERVTGHRYDAGDRVFVRIAGETFVIPRVLRAGAAANRDELRSDMPGTVVKHHVKLGQRVAPGDPLVTVESMKLQVVIAADRDGVIKTLPFAEGAAFDRGAVLVTLGDSA
ncbi:MAG TPA: biotin/lipoyl-containing protein [Kofleriaceae bacterium]